MESNIKKKKILSISVLPLGWKGNVNIGMPSVYLIQKELTNRGFDNRYITIGDRKSCDYSSVDNIHIYNYQINTPVSSRRIIFTIYQSIYSVLLWIKTIRIATRLIKEYKPDVIVGHTFYCALPAYFVAKRAKVPYIFREYGTMKLYDIVSNSIIKKITRWYEIIAYKIPAQAYIFTDDGSKTKEAAIKLGVKEKKIWFLKNGIINADIVVPKKLPSDRLTIVTAGRLSKYKCMDDIIKGFSMANLSNADLYIIGDGEMFDELNYIAKVEDVENQIIFTGALPREEVLSYFKASDIVVAMGSINPMMEAMACGKPTISLELGSTADILNNMEDGIILKDRKPKSIAEALVLLANNKDLRCRMGNNANITAYTKFKTWQDRASEEIDIIESIIEYRN